MRSAWVSLALAALVAGCGARGEMGPTPEERAEAAAFFLQQNAQQDGVTTLPSGLQYRVVQSGPPGGRSPDSNDLVRVDYEGATTDGRVFDSSFGRGQPYVTAPDQVVPGWTEALQRMKVGDEWILYVPPALGYGAEGRPPAIPANAVLVFKLRLLDMAETPGGGRGVGQAMG